MKLILNENEKQKLDQCFEAEYVSEQSSALLNDYLKNGYLALTEEMKDVKKQDAVSSFKDHFLSHYDFEGDDLLLLNQYCSFPSVREEKKEDYLMNPYCRNISFSEENKGRWSLSHNYYEPFEGFTSSETIGSKERYYGEKVTLGFFKEKFAYPIVLERNKVWMSLTPHEVHTMEKPIEDAKGKVITFGLGLGYFTYLVSRKKEVESVAVVEEDRNVISLFEQYILPQMETKDKIHIIRSDAFGFLKKQVSLECDYLFVDIYHNETDALPIYLKMKQMEKEHPSTVFAYWIEESIISYIRRFLISILEESQEGYTESDYESPESEEEEILSYLYNKTKDKVFTSYSDIEDFLSSDSIRKLLR